MTTRSMVAWMMSATPRPVTTVEEDMGMDRKRSMKPFSLFCVTSNAVFMNPNAVVMANMPGIAKSTYPTPAPPPVTSIADPKT